MTRALILVAGLSLAACGSGERTPEPAATGAAAPAATAPAASTPVTADVGAGGMPRQRPGLWRVTVNLPMVGPQSMDQCITPAEAAAGMDINASDMGGCGTPAISRDAEGWTVNTTCDAGGQRNEVRSRISGDPQSRYTVTTTVGAAGGSPMEIRADAQYVGPCPA